MSRSRNIKPGFFKNEVLAELTPWARLTFIGLWTLADREGRLEDRPKRIKAELFPFDDVDVDQVLGDLATHGFIERYDSHGASTIQVINFGRHQNPHHREQPSTLPAPPSVNNVVSSATNNPDMPKTSPGPAQGKPQASPCLGKVEPHTSRADSLLLIPDSLSSETVVSAALRPPPDSDANGAVMVQAKSLTAKERLWATGLHVLGEKGRAHIGKLCKTYGDDVVADVLASAVNEQPIDPKSWVTAGCEALFKRRGANAPKSLLDVDQRPTWLDGTGFDSVWSAESAGCGPGNAEQFRAGQKVPA